ncbi:MAG TPA: histidine phosphatase family protein [Polyangiaceae bacterium LLY-WYZ-14_1]|nr:histidine phosphatase family protein [Polyangiaceae bacterium LLY-WYZ-14_1]
MAEQRSLVDPVEVTLVRHAETTSNRDGIWQGQGDAGLSDTGEGQAEALGERLRALSFDRMLCSDLVRTETTLRLALPGSRPEPSPRWREIDVGRWEGLSRAEVASRYADEIAALKRGEPVPVGGGESWRDLESRVDAALRELLDGLEGGARVLVMTHGGVIHALVSGLFGLRGLPPPRPIGRVMNTAVTVLRFDAASSLADDGLPSRVEVDRYNDAGHLPNASEAIREHLGRGEAVVRLDADEAIETDDATAPDLDAGTAGAGLPGPGDPRLAWLDALAATRPAPTSPDPQAEVVPRHRAAARRIADLAHATIGAPSRVVLTPLARGRGSHFLLGQRTTLADYGLDP